MSIDIGLKNKALELRKQGLSYSEILKQIPIAKSTLASWLKEIGLSKAQKQAITQKRIDGSKRGGESRRKTRLEKEKKLKEGAAKEIGRVSNRELFLIGVSLYWAEGSKEKSYCPGSGVSFSNSDGRMIKLFLLWLSQCCKIEKKDVKFEIYIHENNVGRVKEISTYWSKVTGLPIDNFSHVYFKKDKPKTKRKNTGELYFGNLRVKVRKSSDLNRKIAGWIDGIYKGANLNVKK